MVAKKTAKKATPARKPAAKKSVSKKTKQAEMQSFKLYKNEENFTEFKITKQTLYWTILLGFIALTQLWILKVQLEIAEITNTIIMQ